MHKGTRHVGKAPQHLVDRAVASAGIAQLRQELEQAVREERYEDAARLKGEIQNAEAAIVKTAAAPAVGESPSI
jgi:protein arginine kinase activator